MTIFLALCFIWCASVTYGSPIGGNDTAQRGLDIDVDAWGKKEVCMKELGCFAITDDFKSLLHRPVNVLPHDRATINARSLLYTRKNAKESHVLVASDKESFTESNLNKDNPTKFIVHGFMDSELYGPWMLAMKDEFLMHGDYNIIVVDWSGGNKPPYYQATSNTRVVGAEIALIIKALEKYAGIKRENCHIIGHSLGSHVAGYAGAILKTLGRITGCDPAEPYFQNMPTSVRLDPSDADYVDVIHSDATDIMFIGFGMSHSVGHVDFFPNNGRKQPGCKADKFKSFITDGLNEGARRFVSCNHQRSLDFFYHSINYRKVVPVGYECTSWNDFLAGKCAECGPDTKRCAIMGIRADEYYEFRNSSVQRNMYLQTSGKSPFWLYHYQVTVKLYRPKASYKDVEGTMDITLVGSKGDELAHIQQKATEFFHGARYQYLVTTERDLGEIKSVTLKWFSSSNNPIKMIFKPKLTDDISFLAATEFFHGARYQYLVTTERDLGEIKSVTLKWFSSSNNPIKMIFKPKLTDDISFLAATEFFHGARYQYLVTTERDLGEIKSVTLKWFSSSNNPIKMIFKPKLYVEYVTVIPMNVIEKSPRTKKNRSFCAKPENGITPKTITTLHRDDKCVR